jgi:hypothetical protein
VVERHLWPRLRVLACLRVSMLATVFEHTRRGGYLGSCAASTHPKRRWSKTPQEIVKLAMVVVGGLTALCLCECRRLRSICQTYSDIDGVDRGNATRLPGAHEARGGCYRRAHGTMLVCVTKVKRCLSNLPRHRRRQNPSTGEATRVVASHEACGVRCGCLMGLCWCE